MPEVLLSSEVTQWSPHHTFNLHDSVGGVSGGEALRTASAMRTCMPHQTCSGAHRLPQVCNVQTEVA